MQHSIGGNAFIKNYEFDFNFSPPWGQCSVIMTSVVGHLTGLEFAQEYRKWNACAPGQLFDAPIETGVDKVCLQYSPTRHGSDSSRTRKPSQPTLRAKPNMLELCSFGQIVTGKGSILVLKYGKQPSKAIEPLKSKEHSSAIPREGTFISICTTGSHDL